MKAYISVFTNFFLIFLMVIAVAYFSFGTAGGIESCRRGNIEFPVGRSTDVFSFAVERTSANSFIVNGFCKPSEGYIAIFNDNKNQEKGTMIDSPTRNFKSKGLVINNEY